MASDDIQGKVTDSDGVAVSGAEVYLFSQNNVNNVIKTTTDSNGNYIFEHHPDGDGTSQQWYVTTSHTDVDQFTAYGKPYVSAQISPTIPDSGDLRSRYNAPSLSLNDGDTVNNFSDETGNGNDLSANGMPTYKTSGINSSESVLYDGTDDQNTTGFSSNISLPYTVAFVAQFLKSSSNPEYLFDGDTNVAGISGLRDTNVWELYAGNSRTGGTQDTNPHVFVATFTSSSDVLRVDSTEVINADCGAADLDGVSLGSRGDESFYGNCYIGEVLVYESDQSANYSDIESYLADQWSITL